MKIGIKVNTAYEDHHYAPFDFVVVNRHKTLLNAPFCPVSNMWWTRADWRHTHKNDPDYYRSRARQKLAELPCKPEWIYLHEILTSTGQITRGWTLEEIAAVIGVVREAQIPIGFSDFRLQFRQGTKWRKLLKIYQDLADMGAPLDCVGIQIYRHLGKPFKGWGLLRIFREFKALGVQVHLAELGVFAKEGQQAEQQQVYEEICQIAVTAGIDSVCFWQPFREHQKRLERFDTEGNLRIEVPDLPTVLNILNQSRLN